MRRKRRRKADVCVMGVILSALLLVGCTNNESVLEETQIKEGPEIQLVSEGSTYDLDENSHVLATYAEYNYQVNMQDLFNEFRQEGVTHITLKEHTVTATDESNSQDGQYDVIDCVTVIINTSDANKVLSQTIEKTVTFKRDAATLEWDKISEICNEWNANCKNLGGTAWHMSTPEGDYYIRLRETMEFFHVSMREDKSVQEADFSTTLVGAYATIKGDEQIVERIHIMGGSITAGGEITLQAHVYDMEAEDYKEEIMEVRLTEYEKTNKKELPFTEEEYKEVTAW